MQLSTLYLTATAGLLSIVSAGQVNFYSDTNCQNYIGSSFPSSFQTIGCVFFKTKPAVCNHILSNLGLTFDFAVAPQEAFPLYGSTEIKSNAATLAARILSAATRAAIDARLPELALV